MAIRKDSVAGTLLAAFLICVICGLIISVAAISLRPLQETNRLLDRQVNVLRAAGIYAPGMDVQAAFGERVQRRFVEMGSGREVERPGSYDQQAATRDPEQSSALAEDPAGIRRLPHVAEVYWVLDDQGQLNRLILPVSGYGLWSTMYGYLALEADADTVAGLVFYQHGETPGLGGEIDNPAWQARWRGKRLTDDQGVLRIEVVKGAVDPGSAQAIHQVDGLSGATLTAHGVSQMVRFWTGPQAFGPYLQQLRDAAAVGSGSGG